jgi:hypothetical protein
VEDLAQRLLDLEGAMGFEDKLKDTHLVCDLLQSVLICPRTSAPGFAP